MTVRVVYTDKRHGFVEDTSLDDLASSGLIKAFSLQGSSKWVKVRYKHLNKNR